MKAYLVAYNGLLAAGWLSVLFLMVKHFWYGGSSETVFRSVEFMLKVSQTTAILEVVHCMLKIVPSSVLLTLIQVCSRLFVLWPVTTLIPDVQSSRGVLLYIVCWTVTEIMRYSYYVCNLFNSIPDVLVWCRYSLFIVLYPLGVTGELIAISNCFLSVKESRKFSIDLPNAANFGFSFHIMLLGVMALYVPLFPQLYFHMFAQRSKVLRKKVN